MTQEEAKEEHAREMQKLKELDALLAQPGRRRLTLMEQYRERYCDANLFAKGIK